MVEDDVDLHAMLQIALQQEGFAVESADDGLTALQNVRRTQPDLVVLDLNMPRMGGKECLSELKKDRALQHIPVIMYTTSSQSKDIEETMLKGAMCFITKPTNLKELKNILHSISRNVHNNLEKCLRTLSNTSNTFIVC